jgi:hypothetical protein
MRWSRLLLPSSSVIELQASRNPNSFDIGVIQQVRRLSTRGHSHRRARREGRYFIEWTAGELEPNGCQTPRLATGARLAWQGSPLRNVEAAGFDAPAD